MHRPSRIQQAIARLGTASILGLMACSSSWASHIGEELTTDQQIVGSNDSLLRTLAQWETTPAAQRSQRTAQLVQIAAQRQQRLLALLERNPKVAASRFLPAAVRDRLPAEAQRYVEREVRAAGTVVATVADDFERGRAKTDFMLHLNDNALQKLQLRMADSLGSERDMLGFVGRKVSLTGTQVDGQIVITAKQSVLMAADGTGSTVTTVGTTPIVKGDQKTLSILLNFSDAALSCTATDLQNRLFGSTGTTVNTNFRNSSLNQVSFSGNVVGPFNINYSAAGTCDYNGWASAAEAAAKAAGIDTTQYARVNYVTPTNSTCGWGGLAYMPGKQSWVQSCTSTGIFSHELGHNLSLHHAATPTSEYGDGSDPMGGARPVLFSAANRVMAGWMAPGTVVDITAGGTFALDALSLSAPSSPQVMRIFKADTNEWYHVSLRKAVENEIGLSTTYLDKITVVRATGKLPAKTTLMAVLGAGQAWTDTANGITITHQSLVGNTSTVGVSMTGATCTTAAPTVAVSPASQSGSPGTARSYTVSVKNNNTAACGTGTVALAQALPAGFTGSVPTSVSVSPGATVSTTWTVTPSATVGAGSYGVDLSGAVNGLAATGHGTFSVMVDTAAPVVAIAYPVAGSTVSGRSVTLSATASDAGSGVSKVEFYVDGRLLATDTSSPYAATWNLRKVTKTGHTITVRAYDAAGNKAEATSSVIVN